MQRLYANELDIFNNFKANTEYYFQGFSKILKDVLDCKYSRIFKSCSVWNFTFSMNTIILYSIIKNVFQLLYNIYITLGRNFNLIKFDEQL